MNIAESYQYKALDHMKMNEQNLLWKCCQYYSKYKNPSSFAAKKRYRFFYNRSAEIYNKKRGQQILKTIEYNSNRFL